MALFLWSQLTSVYLTNFWVVPFLLWKCWYVPHLWGRIDGVFKGLRDAFVLALKIESGAASQMESPGKAQLEKPLLRHVDYSLV